MRIWSLDFQGKWESCNLGLVKRERFVSDGCQLDTLAIRVKEVSANEIEVSWEGKIL